MSPPQPDPVIARVPVRCRPLTAADREPLTDLLARGFPQRSRDFWERAIARLERHAADHRPDKLGYGLEADGALVGCILTIVTTTLRDGQPRTRCNLSSWYVDPAFRAYGSLLVKTATRDRLVTYVNNSPAQHTLQSIEAQGFAPYCSGLLFAVPLASWRPGRGVRVTDGARDPIAAAEPADRAVMRAHDGRACLRLWCERDGRAFPFVFARTWQAGERLPVAQLVYCADLAALGRFAGAIGLFLARHGLFVITCATDAPVPGLVGLLRRGKPKYFKGPDQPRPGDQTYTELPLFGL